VFHQATTDQVAPEDTGAAFRYRLRSTAARVLGDRHRTYSCGFRISEAIQVCRTAQGGAYYVGVKTCGSLWTCPVCAAKIAEGRRADLERLLDGHHERAGAAYMLTLTIPHGRFDRLAALRQAVAGAWRKVQAGAGWKHIKAACAMVGTVRALEVTHGANGWHPHLHILLLTSAPLARPGDLHRAIYERWAAQVKKITGTDCSFNASDMRRATVADYVAKWGVDAEIARAATKISKKGGRSPWQLLADAGAGCQASADLFREYADAMHGARHLTWSRGLKAEYGVDERDDLDLAETTPEASPELPLQTGAGEGCIGHLDRGAWAAICHHDLTGAVLAAAGSGGWQAVEKLLARYHIGSYFLPDELPKPPTWKHVAPVGVFKGRKAVALTRAALGGIHSQGRETGQDG
jgi:hypothetical protein